MASPFKVSSLTLTWCIGVEPKVESIVRGEEKTQLITDTKVIAAIRRTRKRRLAIAPWLGIVDIVWKSSKGWRGWSVAVQEAVSVFM